MATPFDIVIVAQKGRIGFEALIFVASLRKFDTGFDGTLYVAEPSPGPLWPGDPRIRDRDLRQKIEELGGVFLPFESRHFGATYPNGNKVEALLALPGNRPFVFFDSDTLVTGPISKIPFDFDRPSASMRRKGTWPVIPLYGPDYTAIWRGLYERFGIEFESSLDPQHPENYWERYLYFNAGWFFGRDPHVFGSRMIEIMTSLRDSPGDLLASQKLDPWLDQIALPLVIHELGGGRPGSELDGLDGNITCHYRALPLLYARENLKTIQALEDVTAPNQIKKLLKAHEPMKRIVYQGRGKKIRTLFEGAPLPRREQTIRNRIRRAGLWMR